MSKPSLALSVLIHAGALAGMAWVDSSGVGLPRLAGGKGQGTLEVGLYLEEKSTSNVVPPHEGLVPREVEARHSSDPENPADFQAAPLAPGVPPTDPSPEAAPRLPEEDPTENGPQNSEPGAALPARAEETTKVEEGTMGGPGTEAPEIDDPAALRPVYPMTCRRLGHHGVVVVRILVGPDGKALEAEVERSAGCQELDQAALNAVLKSRFRPARSWGQAVTSRVELPFRFELRENRLDNRGRLKDSQR